MLKKICVYCGSNPGRLEAYAAAVRELARALVERQLGLVYGGASVGSMGLLADTVLNLGGHVTGVIPKSLVSKEVAHDGLTELRVTESMHQRKRLMAELSDGFIAMPGGIGTLEELFEVWTWSQLGFHQKPCALLNVEGYFDHLLSFLDHVTREQFLLTPHRSSLIASGDPRVILDRFSRYQAPSASKWVEPPARKAQGAPG